MRIRQSVGRLPGFTRFPCSKIYKFLVAAISLVVGGAIYIVARPLDLLLFEWAEYLKIKDWILVVRGSWLSDFLKGEELIVYSLPNALWLFSGLLALDCIWRKKPENRLPGEGKMWLSLFFAIAIFLEVGQGVKYLPGTFDWTDIIFLVMALFAFLIFVFESEAEKR